MDKKRPRKQPIPLGVGIVEDPLAYIPNKTTPMSRKLKDIRPGLYLEIHYDKHYANRNQFGDAMGARDGIGLDDVGNLVESSLKHLVYFSSIVKSFSFVVYDNTPRGQRKQVGLQQECDDGIMLNVVIEGHHLEADTYEITIVTAMKINGFFDRSGEYVIEILDKDQSILRMVNDRRALQEVHRT